MSKTKTAISSPSLLTATYLVMGSGYWGKATTVTKALENAHNPKAFVAYRVHPDTEVLDDGGLRWPLAEGGDHHAYRPVEIDRMPRVTTVKSKTRKGGE